ncbi:autophagocytosis associated protein, putative [Eimeria tenella]|uniref:Autophagocytosis associated protein, putative n=1 Tax=Eimeria tenella TaxID=5802 RepID=U6L2R3_EIMTE|nr:autophagocytosis associated protein, putative [Eimeria tenella]CDJ42060.1 autophagocytosis associated protein, putative [Eimeria tenella]|eukprot:XP_013232810.1 autophagocytosis associated protein, putative [Eimeria tenella]
MQDDPACADSSTSYFVRNAPDAGKESLGTYDLSITYDKYFQTPRLWLFGYNESGTPLTPVEIFEDILTDYAAKTVTVDPHPCTGVPTASIHPCKHAQVMKKVVDHWRSQGVEPRPDLALIVLLKFISSVVPTIDYDFTMDIDMGLCGPHTTKREG